MSDGMPLEFERTAWRDDDRAARQVDRIRERQEHGIDLVAGLPETVRPGHLLVRLSQVASFARARRQRRVRVGWRSRAAFKADFDESQDFRPFPDPTWGWISWRGPVVLAQTNFEDGPQAFRFAMDPPMASIEDRETWVRLARMVTGAPHTGRAVEEYTRLGSGQANGVDTGAARVEGPAPTMVLRHRIGGPESDRRSLLRAGERGLDLVLGLPEGPLDLWPERPTPWSVRYLDRGTPVRAVVTLGQPQWCTFVIEPLDDHGSGERLEGWASLADRWPVLAAFESTFRDEPDCSGWLEAPFPEAAEDEDENGESMSPGRLVAVLRALTLARDGLAGRLWLFE